MAKSKEARHIIKLKSEASDHCYFTREEQQQQQGTDLSCGSSTRSSASTSCTRKRASCKPGIGRERRISRKHRQRGAAAPCFFFSPGVNLIRNRALSVSPRWPMSSDRVLVVIGRTRHKMVVVELQEAVKRGAKFIELRLDFLAKAVDFKRLAAVQAVPVGRDAPPPGRRRAFLRHRAGTADDPPAGDRLRRVRVGRSGNRHRRHHSPVRPGQADHQLPQPDRDAAEPGRDLRRDAQAGRATSTRSRSRPRTRRTWSACCNSSRRRRSRRSRSAWATSASRAASWR